MCHSIDNIVAACIMLLEHTGEKLYRSSVGDGKYVTLRTILQPHVLCYLSILERNYIEAVCEKVNMPLLRQHCSCMCYVTSAYWRVTIY